ncbi:MAG: cytochrome c oxidase subunit II [Acidobacteria bacterium]|nr:cytochrome c oxidase subunit II [Acidobacteriota bacterium]
MQSSTVPLFPEQASSFALQVDLLYLFLTAVSAFFTILVSGIIIFFAIKYRRRSDAERPPMTVANLLLEITWIVVPLAISFVMFIWGAAIFFKMASPPKEAMDIYVTGKQWMWKIQHVNGHREINELHVPLGKPVRLTMTSEDVLHSFYIPAFRIKADVIPGSYSKMWFQATKPGKYHLFCAEYCGTKHSGMIGSVIVMEQSEYDAWLGNTKDSSLAEAGQKLFKTMGCVNCHSAQSDIKGPNLEGIYGKQVRLQDGNTLIADERYLRESLLVPNAKLTEGFPANMPAYQGLITEEQILQLISYMRTLTPVVTSNTPSKASTPVTQATPKPEATPAPKPPANSATTESKPSGSTPKSEPAK